MAQQELWQSLICGKVAEEAKVYLNTGLNVSKILTYFILKHQEMIRSIIL